MVRVNTTCFLGGGRGNPRGFGHMAIGGGATNATHAPQINKIIQMLTRKQRFHAFSSIAPVLNLGKSDKGTDAAPWICSTDRSSRQPCKFFRINIEPVGFCRPSARRRVSPASCISLSFLYKDTCEEVSGVGPSLMSYFSPFT